MTNLNEFKRPKKYVADMKYQEDFLRNVFKALAGKKIFEFLKKGEYKGIFPLIRELR